MPSSSEGITLNGRSSGPGMDVLRGIPRRVCVVSGSGKLHSLRGALAAGLITDLIIDLGIQHVYQGIHDKRVAFAELLEETGVTAEECGYIGDDVIDLPLLMQVGFAVAVPSGHAEVQHRVHYVTRAAGGRGAVREVCDLVMRAQGTYDQALAPYFA